MMHRKSSNTSRISDIFIAYSKETLFALAIGLISCTYYAKPALAIANTPPKPITSIRSVQSNEVFTKNELSAITSSWDESEPPGRFLQDRHGFTHYCLEGVEDGSTSKGTIVLCTGIGVSHHGFEFFSGYLVAAGYSVLKYDYYGHGYSKFGGQNMWIEYSPETFVDQLEDLLDFVEREDGIKAVGIVGHSTGGIVCTYANERWSRDGCKRSIIPKMILAAPAFYAKKPFMARVADAIPGTLTFLMKKIPPARMIIGDSYMEAGEIAFAKCPETKETIYPMEEQQKKDRDNILFGNVKGREGHPFLAASILGINCHTLREDLLPGHRDSFLNVLEKSGEGEPDVLWVWGNLDATVPFEDNVEEVQKWENNFSNLKLSVQDRLGHELFFENSKQIADVAIPFLDA